MPTSDDSSAALPGNPPVWPREYITGIPTQSTKPVDALVPKGAVIGQARHSTSSSARQAGVRQGSATVAGAAVGL